MFVTQPIIRTAKKDHKCIWCAEKIEKGTVYSHWKSVDDSWVASRCHPECFDDLQEECQFNGGEFMPYCGERPRDVK